MEEMLRDGKCAHRPVDVEVPPKPCELPTDIPAGSQAEKTVLGGTGPGRRIFGGGEVSVMAGDSGPSTPAHVVDTLHTPNIVSYLYEDMREEDLHTLRKQRGYSRRDARWLLIARLLSTDQIDQKRAPDGPGAESYAPKKRSLLAVLQPAFVAEKGEAKQHGYGRKLGALPGAPADAADAVISAWTEDLSGKTLGKKPSREKRKYAPLVLADQ